MLILQDAQLKIRLPSDLKQKIEEVANQEKRSIYATPPNPLFRKSITEPLFTGVRAIDGLLTIGKGQRAGKWPNVRYVVLSPSVYTLLR